MNDFQCLNRELSKFFRRGLWGVGGGGVGSGKESCFENVKWNQKCSSKNENFQTLLFFKISTWPQKTNCRTLVPILFSWRLFSPMFLLWELFLIKNCCKLTIRRRPRRKKKISQLTVNTDSYQSKNQCTFKFLPFWCVNYDIGFKTRMHLLCI